MELDPMWASIFLLTHGVVSFVVVKWLHDRFSQQPGPSSREELRYE